MVYNRVLSSNKVTDGSFVDYRSFEDVESKCQSLSMIEVKVWKCRVRRN
jgi:hypothetical protein